MDVSLSSMFLSLSLNSIKTYFFKKWQLWAPSQSGGIHVRWSRGFLVCESSSSCLLHLHFLPGLCLCDPCLRAIFPLYPVDPGCHQVLLFLPSKYLTFVPLSLLLIHHPRPGTQHFMIRFL
uniref:Uncharacterized protein n=1 Tax=Myotis myotis TaxID=51298 RepID=A0A7J7UPM7_MYOMY|nr:hypothetical protein mMyoMyo1_008599 [Myotis myotis]